MRTGQMNKRMYHAQDRILAALLRLLEQSGAPAKDTANLVAAVENVSHRDANIRRMRQLEAMADLAEFVAAPTVEEAEEKPEDEDPAPDDDDEDDA